MDTTKRDPSGQFNTNIIKESIKDFTEVPANFDTLIDLGEIFVFTHIILQSSLDEDVSIKVTTNNNVENIITLKADRDLWMDDLKLFGIIEFKKVLDAPTEGTVQVICW